MDVGDALKALQGLLEGGLQDSRLQPRYPPVAVEVAPDRVTAVRVGRDRRSGRTLLQKVQTRALPEGAIEPSLVNPNIRTMQPVSDAVREVMNGIGGSDHKVSILLPDHVARVTLLSFTALPRTRRELLDLVRFRMAKSLPFKTEEATVDLMTVRGTEGQDGPAAASVLAVFVKRSIVQQYEMMLTGAGYWPGLVGLSTFELFNLYRGRIESESPADRDALLLNVTPHYLSILIFNDGRIIFYRCKPHQAGVTPEESIVGLRREIYTSIAFYQEKLLGRGLGRAFLRVAGLTLDAVREAVSSEVACDTEHLDPLQIVTPAEGVTLGADEANWMAPAAGATVGRVA